MLLQKVFKSTMVYPANKRPATSRYLGGLIEAVSPASWNSWKCFWISYAKCILHLCTDCIWTFLIEKVTILERCQGIFKHNKNNMKRKSVKSLKSRCFETLGPFVTKCIRKTVSNANSAQWYGELHGNLDINADYIINKQVELLKNYLWSHIIWYDYDKMFKTLLQSIENALHITRKTWNPKSNMSQYRRVSTNWIPVQIQGTLSIKVNLY